MVEQNQPFVSVYRISEVFEKIYDGLDTYQLDELDKELMKIYPSEESKIWFYADYDEEDNTVGISIYITNPCPLSEEEETISPMDFDRLMITYLIRADIGNLPQLACCLGKMEEKQGEEYEIDFIPVHYTKKIDKYNIHFRITKKQSSQ